MPRFDAVLGVVTHVRHWPGDGGPVAYEPYVREMNVWGRLFRDVQVVAPRGDGVPIGHVSSYAEPKIHWRPVDYTMAVSKGAQLRRMSQLPGLLGAMWRLIGDCDVVLLRSPGHPALFGRILTALAGRPSVTKWAGLFDSFPGERVPSRVERTMVRRMGEPTLIYGPSSSPRLIPFIPALMSQDELAEARHLAEGRTWDPPWRILSVGRLSPVKGFDLALEGAARLRRLAPELKWRYTLVGDGPQRTQLMELSDRLGIADRVDFTGPLPFLQVQRLYAEAHVVVMPGVKEGWPKVIAESWAHGAVPLAARAGIVPWIMYKADLERLLFEPEPEALGRKLLELLGDRELSCRMSRRGYAANQALSLESFSSGIERVLVEHCGLT